MVNCFSAGVSSYPADFLACTGGLGKRRDIPPGERPMRMPAALLRRHLARRRWRIDEVGRELLVARAGVLHRLLLHRAVAADAVGQRKQLDGGVVRGL